jgi:peroxiredoxin
MKIHIPHVIFALLLLTIFGQINAQKSNYLSLIDESLLLPGSKIIVINIWNTKYSDEIDKLNELTVQYKEKNVVFLAITDEDTDEVDLFLKKHPFYYSQLNRIEGEKIFNHFQTGMFKVFPMHIIIDQSGVVTYKKKNSVKNIEKKLAKKIDLLLKNNTNSYLPKATDTYTMNKNFNK